MKKAFTIFSILLLTFGLFMHGFAVKCPAYADDDSNFIPLRQQSDMVVAFQEYCKSRDVTIEGSIADGVTSFTTSTFNALCNTLGFNMTQLQAEIKAEYDDNGRPFKFLFTATGIDAYNRIFGQFLQDNDLAVGDTDVDKTVYDGASYNGSLIYVVSGANGTTSGGSYANPSNILQIGSSYGISENDIASTWGTVYSTTSTVFGNTIVYDVNSFNNYYGSCSLYVTVNNTSISQKIFNKYNSSANTPFWRGYGCIVYNVTTKSYYAGMYRYDGSGPVRVDYNGIALFTDLDEDVPGFNNNTKIYIYSPTINNNTYEGDTIINNYPDNPDDPDPDDPDPIYPDPEYPDPPTYDPDYPNEPITPQTPPDDWGIDLPDFTDFDWIMSGLEKKFPWDIPFNIMFMLSLFAAEPEAPHFVGDIDLKVTTWHYDLDLAPFEDLAEIFRKFFFISFILGLMLLTKQLIWG